ncbi:hypothetical protein RclHR1_04170012 [Rhizophagus clarus]|uniref:Uncharacterized protein n=1 Tax=Rhizophagus clarus TaxID=94130 RepID=A0A2Z6S9T9_9GLOM|nr:hypothetical protein RclHR1_04170012 [Rhizophagus clarus]GES76403.1 hypothetical protein RCL_jg26281.t1 [Rhizophagus clarus]
MSDNMDIDHDDIKNDPEIIELIEYLEAKKSVATSVKRPEIVAPSIKVFNNNHIDHIGNLKQLRHVHMKGIRRIRRHHEETFAKNKKLGITNRDANDSAKSGYKKRKEDAKFFDKAVGVQIPLT